MVVGKLQQQPLDGDIPTPGCFHSPACQNQPSVCLCVCVCWLRLRGGAEITSVLLPAQVLVSEAADLQLEPV